VALLYEIGSSRALEAILAKQNGLPAALSTQVIYCALRTWPPAKVYEEFSPLLAEKKGANKAKNEMLQHVIRVARSGFVGDAEDYYVIDETDRNRSYLIQSNGIRAGLTRRSKRTCRSSFPVFA